MPKLQYLAPSPGMRNFVSVYYLFEVPEERLEDQERAAVAQIRMVIDGAADVRFVNGDFEPNARGSVVMGPTSAVSHFTVHGPARVFGVGLLPAGWGALTNACASEVVDRVVPAGALFPRLDIVLEKVRAATELVEMVEIANTVLEPVMADADPEMLAFIRMVDDWLESDVSPEIANLQARSDLSARHLTRRVKQYYGMPPKYLARKYRALRAARALAHPDIEEADYLRDAFYDQSHMIREIKRFTGTTPAKLRKGEGDIAAMIDRRALLMGQISPLTALT